MNLGALEQYDAMRREAAALADELRRIKPRQVTDTVTGSSPEHPYGKRVITVSGVDMRRLRSRRIRLALRRARLAKQLSEIEAWMDTVTDSRVRMLVRLHYLEGRSWAAAATAAYGWPCADAARMRVKRFFEKD